MKRSEFNLLLKSPGKIAAVAILCAAAWFAGRQAGGRETEVFDPAERLPERTIQQPDVRETNWKSRLEQSVAGKTGLARRLAWQRAYGKPSARELLERQTAGFAETVRLVREWASHDAAAAWAWMRGREEVLSAFLNSSGVAGFFTSWARQDPAGAIRARGLLDYNGRGSAAQGVLALLMDDDLMLRAKIAERVPELTAGGDFNLNTNSEWIVRNPAGAAGKIASLPPSVARSMLLKETGRIWMAKDWRAAAEWMNALPEEAARTVMPDIARQVFAVNYESYKVLEWRSTVKLPERGDEERFEWTREWLETRAPSSQRALLGPLFAQHLAARDPAAALDWARENLGGLSLKQAVAGVTQGLYDQNPEQALEIVGNLPPGGVRQQTMTGVADRWIKDDPAGAVEWMRTHEDAEKPFFNWRKAGEEWAFRDPAGFRVWMAAEEGTDEGAPELSPDFLEGAARGLFAKDGPAAFGEWVRSLPEGPLRQAAERRLEAGK